MNDAAEQSPIRDIARDVLSQIAPQQLSQFTAASAAYFSDPVAAQKVAKSRGER